MPKEMGHVKNPLTVIAIFAGIAETSGAAILPFLDKDIQGTFVWFLMFFPCLLIALFFGVLYKKHHVLYAPSDYKEDKSFVDLHFTTKVGFNILGRESPPIEALPTEAAEVRGGGEATEAAEVGEHAKEQGAVSLQPSPRAGGAVEEPGADNEEKIIPPNAKTNSAVDAEALSRVVPVFGGAISGLLRSIARKKVLSGLAQKLGGAVEVHVQSKHFPNITFDAVIDSGATKSIVEFVDVVPDRDMLQESVKGSLRMARFFWESLNEQEKGQFVFHLALMHWQESHAMRIASLKEIVDLSLAMPFKTVATLYECDAQNINSYDLRT
jgi:hypothetical protein